jgi:hypothetical protein
VRCWSHFGIAAVIAVTAGRALRCAGTLVRARSDWPRIARPVREPPPARAARHLGRRVRDAPRRLGGLVRLIVFIASRTIVTATSLAAGATRTPGFDHGIRAVAKRGQVNGGPEDRSVKSTKMVTGTISDEEAASVG